MSLAMPTTHTTSDANQTIQNSPAQGLYQGHESSLFSHEELREFAANDASAGRNIAKILTTLFIYTVIAMSIAIWWTFRTVGH